LLRLPLLDKDALPSTTAAVSSVPMPLAAHCNFCKRNFKYTFKINVPHDQLIKAKEQWMKIG
jgi:hypothetical protein